MAISITNEHEFFDNKKNLLIVLKDELLETNISYKKDGDFVFIFNHKNIVGINVFNYSKYFEVKPGFHLINDEIKNYLLKHFNLYVKEKDLKPFYQIGQIENIEQHPSSDKLFILTVNFWDCKRKIITNVKKIEKNHKYLFAINGAITSSGLRIINSKIMNVSSEGMIMSYKSLGKDNEEIINCDDYELNEDFIF